MNEVVRIVEVWATIWFTLYPVDGIGDRFGASDIGVVVPSVVEPPQSRPGIWISTDRLVTDVRDDRIDAGFAHRANPLAFEFLPFGSFVGSHRYQP